MQEQLTSGKLWQKQILSLLMAFLQVIAGILRVFTIVKIGMVAIIINFAKRKWLSFLVK